ncbi:hypothetical protein ACH5RR_006961 [Cinchona calisaya]|uniref:Uncharacterized protein n=1 Tax=Cinchona calisaya TaxID=153742 RepID=A0ABD3AQJ6_9GENT
MHRRFNEVLYSEEFDGKMPCPPPPPQWQMNYFQTALSNCDLFDLGFSGNKFMWCYSRRDTNSTRARLDRACASASWSPLFPTSELVHLLSQRSDHLSILLRIREQILVQHPCCSKPFRFEAMWVKSEDWEEIIRDSWESSSSREEKYRASIQTRQLLSW